MASTLKDVADAVGLSQVTVSKALRGTGRISPAARKRILAAAEELRYRPNAGARSMRLGRTRIVGFVYSPEGMFSGLNTELLGGILETLRAHNFDLMLGEVFNVGLAEPGQVAGLLRHWTADGLLIHNQIDLPPAIVEMIEKDEIPAIWMNTNEPVNCVYFDEFTAMKQATKHLIELGHRRITYVDHSNPLSTMKSHHYSVKSRLDGYEAAMVEAGLKPLVAMEVESVPPDTKVSWCQKVLDVKRRPTAIVTYGTADHLMYACANLGLKVPADISLIHVSGARSPINDVRITRLFQPFRDLGAAAVRGLLARLEGATGHSVPSIAVGVTLIPAASTAPPSTARAS